MEIKKGDVFRLGNWPYADAVVTDIDKDGNVTLARPFAYASDVSRMPVISLEIIEHVGPSAMSGYTKVDAGRVL